MLQHSGLDDAQLGARLARLLAPDSPLPAREMVARGLAPLAGAEPWLALYQLWVRGGATLADQASRTAADLPAAAVVSALVDPHLPAVVLDFMARRRLRSPETLRLLVHHPRVADPTLQTIARAAPTPVCDALAHNQRRWLACPAIAVQLIRNPHCDRASAHAVLELGAREGVAALADLRRDALAGAVLQDSPEVAARLAAWLLRGPAGEPLPDVPDPPEPVLPARPDGSARPRAGFDLSPGPAAPPPAPARPRAGFDLSPGPAAPARPLPAKPPPLAFGTAAAATPGPPTRTPARPSIAGAPAEPPPPGLAARPPTPAAPARPPALASGPPARPPTPAAPARPPALASGPPARPPAGAPPRPPTLSSGPARSPLDPPILAPGTATRPPLDAPPRPPALSPGTSARPALATPDLSPGTSARPALGAPDLSPGTSARSALAAPDLSPGTSARPALDAPPRPPDLSPGTPARPALGAPDLSPGTSARPALGAPDLSPGTSARPALGAPPRSPALSPGTSAKPPPMLSPRTAPRPAPEPPRGPAEPAPAANLARPAERTPPRPAAPRPVVPAERPAPAATRPAGDRPAPRTAGARLDLSPPLQLEDDSDSDELDLPIAEDWDDALGPGIADIPPPAPRSAVPLPEADLPPLPPPRPRKPEQRLLFSDALDGAPAPQPAPHVPAPATPGRSYADRVACVLDRGTPLTLAMSLLHQLRPDDLRRVAAARHLAAPLVAAARRRVARPEARPR